MNTNRHLCKERLRTCRRDQRRIVIDNLNRKVPVFRNAIQVLWGGSTSGACGNPALKQPYAPLSGI
ncbi:MAG: hypothetical protein HKP58_00625 [Desulfatitalea sp.]|nr:hypothetical protein [Desulfatitalea sp.]NNJ98894.1 hypothetical protein [Desulfatitalea sp.]